MKPTTVRQFFDQFPDDNACLAHLFDVRFGQGHVCPKCERKAKWYKIEAELAYSCQWCGHHIHPQVGTIFQKSRTPLQLWFYAVFLFTTSRHGVSGKELQRQLGVTYKTAWRMANRIRKHMAAIDGDVPIGGEGKVVEVDESYFGGHEPGATGGQGKEVMFGMIERGGDVVIKHVQSNSRASLHGEIEKHVEKGTEVHADTCRAYNKLDEKGYDLKRVNKHRDGGYVGPNGEHVNSIENFWRHLKKSLQGTHISVSPKYLEAYAKEFEYRFNRRMHPETMLSELLSRYPELDA